MNRSFNQRYSQNKTEKRRESDFSSTFETADRIALKRTTTTARLSRTATVSPSRMSRGKAQLMAKKANALIDLLRGKTELLEKLQFENSETESYQFILQLKTNLSRKSGADFGRSGKEALLEKFQRALNVLRTIFEQQTNLLRAAETNQTAIGAFYLLMARKIAKNKGLLSQNSKSRDFIPQDRNRNSLLSVRASVVGSGWKTMGEVKQSGEFSISEIKLLNRITGLYEERSSQSFLEIVEHLDRIERDQDHLQARPSNAQEQQTNLGKPQPEPEPERGTSKRVSAFNEKLPNYESHNQETSASDLLLQPLSQSLILASPKEFGRKQMTLEDFVRFKRQNPDMDAEDLFKLVKERGKPNDDTDESFRSGDAQSANSDINESVLDEIDEALYETGKAVRKKGFSVNKLRQAYKPVKISFIVGVSEMMDLQPQVHRIQKDRIYRDFRIAKICWHFKKGSLTGVKLSLHNAGLDMNFAGHFHGVGGDSVVKMILEPNEGFIKVDLMSSNTEIRRIRILTTAGRTFEMGLSEKQAEAEKLKLVSRYFPREVQLFKFFAKFNTSTERIENLRFLYVKTLMLQVSLD